MRAPDIDDRRGSTSGLAKAGPPNATAADVFELHLEHERLRLQRALLADTDDDAAARLAAVKRRLAEVTHGRDRTLKASLGIDDDAFELMWFVVALTVDPLAAPHAVALGGGEVRRGVTLALFAAVAGFGAARTRALAVALDTGHPLFALGLLEPSDTDLVISMTPLRAARRLIRYLHGDDTLDDEAGTRIPLPTVPVLDTQVEANHARVARALAGAERVLVWVTGAEGLGRRTLVACAARDVGRGAIALDLGRVPPTAVAWARALLALRRECALSGDVPVLLGFGAPSPEHEGEARLRLVARFVEDTPGAVALVGDEGDPPPATGHTLFHVTLAVPPAEMRCALWRLALGASAVPDDRIEELSMRYRMGAGGISRAVAASRLAARARGAAAPSATDLADGVRASIRQRMGPLARRVDVTQEWEDLVLADDVHAQLELLMLRVRHAYQVLERWGFRRRLPRGGGIAALLSGPPGTGKTMAAGLLARAVGLDLFQVDLGAVVSKWAGETEKNLTRLFEVADSGHALLLFDEADALFARRTQVRGAQDRYANLEVNHLLQRIEAFGGVAVLTTNLDAGLDPALRRRLAAHITFDHPGSAERAALWQGLLEGPAPRIEDIDPNALARRFPTMAGGHIRNAVVAAAFRAAADGSPITQAHLQRAATDEYRAMGRIIMDKVK